MRIVSGLLLAFGMYGQTLAGLHTGDPVKIAMVGAGPLCQGKVKWVSGAGLGIRLTSDTIECGKKGFVATVRKDIIYGVSTQRKLTKGRLALKAGAALGAVGTLAAVVLTSSDPESLLLIANPVIPGLAGFAGWSVVPSAKTHLLLITCPDRFHCFSDSAVPPGNPGPPDGR